MDRSKPSEEWHKQRDPWYAALGRFIVWFEWLCEQVRVCIISAEGNFGTPGTQQKALAELDELTAGRLVGKFNEALTYLCASSPEELEIIDSITKRLKELKDKRNDIIHRTWLVDFGGDDFSKAGSWKFKKTESGPQFDPLELEARDFDELIAEARELADMVMLIGALVGFLRPFAKSFRIEDGVARLRKNT
jgi:hypothetical protein